MRRSLGDRVTLVYLGGPLDGQTTVMPARLIEDLPPIRVHHRTASHNHFYSSRVWDGYAGRLDVIYRGVIGMRRES